MYIVGSAHIRVTNLISYPNHSILLLRFHEIQDLNVTKESSSLQLYEGMDISSTCAQVYLNQCGPILIEVALIQQSLEAKIELLYWLCL